VFFIALVAGGLLATAVGLLVTSRTFQFVAATAIVELAFGIAVLVWVRFVDKGPLAALGAPRRPLSDIGAGIAGGLGLTVVAGISSVIVFSVATAILGHRPAQPKQIPDYVTSGAFIATGIVVILAAPFGEELLFRGFIYKGLRRRFSIWPAALISACAFALLHVLPILILAIFPVGIGLALIYEWRQSLLASMAAHATFNLIGFLTVALSRR